MLELKVLLEFLKGTTELTSRGFLCPKRLVAAFFKGCVWFWGWLF